MNTIQQTTSLCEDYEAPTYATIDVDVNEEP